MTWYYAFAAVISIVIHEVSHGWVAYRCGDPTAKEARRLTLNPLRHVDPVGTVLLPLMLIAAHLPPFGWAKPVPVSVDRLRKPRQQSLYVSLAGPGVNVVISVVALWVTELSTFTVDGQVDIANHFFFNLGLAFGLVNLTLAVFNLIPIPPLDGSAIVERFLPDRAMPRYYRIRNTMLPFVFVLVVVDSFTLNLLGHFLGALQNWWVSLLG
jgi:Zn-dependent protease